ncbi:hypothetical protein ACOY5J_05790 [Enterobacter kobei]|uniref:hypothetical protein n=1 Tax=Enterobacter TaxID=547 RepID=UPI0039BFC3EE
MDYWFISYEMVNAQGQRGKGHGFFPKNDDENIEEFAKRIMDQVSSNHGCDPDKVVLISFNRV